MAESCGCVSACEPLPILKLNLMISVIRKLSFIIVSPKARRIREKCTTNALAPDRADAYTARLKSETGSTAP